jgi:hypothetical protein
MKTLTRFLSLLAVVTLAACSGGGGSSGECTFSCTPGGEGGGAIATDTVLVLSSPSIVNNGNETVTATVTALDINRNALKDVPITITADNDAVVTVSGSSVTDDKGVVKAAISIGANTSSRTIVVSAKAGSLTKTANLAVVTGAPSTPTAADISLTLSAATVANSGTATVTATVTAVDNNRNVISGIPVTLKVNNEATIIVSGQKTSSLGVVSGVIGIGANKSNRPILVTAVSGTLTRETAVQVVGTRITATALPTVLIPGTQGRIQYRVVDANNAPLSSFPIRITGVGGVATDAKTDVNGAYEFSYTAPAAAGDLEVRASAGGVDLLTNVIVQPGSGVIPEVLAGSVRSASVRANPSVVAINSTTATTNRTEIRALFVGDANQPIKNIRVRFDLDGDLNSIGGSIASGSTLIYSDPNGVAVSAYQPGGRFSPTDGLTIRACWGYNDAQAIACTNSVRTTLTVIADPLSVTIGTNNVIVAEDPLVYIQRFVVQVNDSSGLAKPDVEVSPLLDLTSYRQGFWVRPSGASEWTEVVTADNCGNEDLNRNGVLEVYSNGQREDANGNRQLDPRKADVVVSFEGTNKTDSSGLVRLRITYPKNIGFWVRYALTVAATGISGTEGRATFNGTLLVALIDVKAEADPPFRYSPYGLTSGNPRVVVTTPDGRSSASLCTQ